MTTDSREPAGPPSRIVGRVAVLGWIVLLSLYPCAYVHARLTHRLVNYGDSRPITVRIERGGYMQPDATPTVPRPENDRDERLFFPCIWLEESVRHLGGSEEW